MASRTTVTRHKQVQRSGFKENVNNIDWLTYETWSKFIILQLDGFYQLKLILIRQFTDKIDNNQNQHWKTITKTKKPKQKLAKSIGNTLGVRSINGRYPKTTSCGGAALAGYNKWKPVSSRYPTTKVAGVWANENRVVGRAAAPGTGSSVPNVPCASQ